ncbi:TrmH family RNA methyltransferase [Parasediminibacterium sp. JCM 36343]|uniref:TrmH family RNA methyltransferase n=1 Tax=Parasediminibacterium sp. JCM 36343 TaxID=3374279 RepID=UPI0039787A5C
MTAERQQKIEQVLSHRQANLTVVLEDVQDPRNITAVMRTCDGVGIQDIYIINTNLPQIRKFKFKSGSSAAKWVTIHQFTNVADCFAELRGKFSTILTTHLSSDAVNLYAIDFTESVALVFGNEQNGISEEMKALADGNFVIPQVGMVQSLNISVACAVSVYEAYRQKKQAGHYDQPGLPEGRLGAMREEWGKA